MRVLASTAPNLARWTTSEESTALTATRALLAPTSIPMYWREGREGGKERKEGRKEGREGGEEDGSDGGFRTNEVVVPRGGELF